MDYYESLKVNKLASLSPFNLNPSPNSKPKQPRCSLVWEVVSSVLLAAPPRDFRPFSRSSSHLTFPSPVAASLFRYASDGHRSALIHAFPFRIRFVLVRKGVIRKIGGYSCRTLVVVRCREAVCFRLVLDVLRWFLLFHCVCLSLFTLLCVLFCLLGCRMFVGVCFVDLRRRYSCSRRGWVC